MSEKIDPSKEAVITVAEIIFQKAIVCSSASASDEPVQQPEWEPVQITELVSAISSHPFDAFVACHRHLHDKVNCQTDKSKEHKLVSKQLKMCLHERDQTVHSCMNKILISVFQIHKNHANISVTVDAELLPRVFEFLTSFTCVSQLTNLLDLFNLHNLNIQELLPYTKQMIDQSCLIHASIVINKFGIHNHFDSNSLLLELLHEDNFVDIETYLQLNNLQLCQNTVKSLLDCDNDESANDEDSKRKQNRLFLQFMRYLDAIHANEDAYKLPVFERLYPNKRKQLNKKIFRFVFDMFKRPIFSQVDDATLHMICPNITMCFYSKQLSGLFFRFKEETVPMSPNVISDHVNALRSLTIGPQLVPQAHEHVLSIYAKRNDFDSASEYIGLHSKHEKIQWNLLSADHQKGLSLSPSISAPEVPSYKAKLSLDGGIRMVETEEQFNECLEQIQKWDFVSLDSEWFNDFFVLRSKTVVSLIQVAHDDTCYLLDLVKLVSDTNRPLHHYLSQFIELVINNKRLLKVGYSVQNDFDIFWRSYLFSLESDTSAEKEEKLASLSPKNILDFRDFYFYLINSPKNYRDLFDQTRLAVSSRLSGISQVTYTLTGYSIDKTEQLSDWSRRPLRQSQIIYAATDAYCLVDCYREIERLFLSKKNLALPTFINDVFHKQNNSTYPQNGVKQKNKEPNFETTNEIPVDLEPIRINQFRCVVDDMLSGIIRYLRICNADVLSSDKNDREKLVLTALKEGRTFITSGQVYERYRKYFASPRDCVKLSNNGTALEQFKQLVNSCRLIIRLEDLFARCSLCNTTPFIIISGKEFRAHHSQYIKQLEEAEKLAATEPNSTAANEKPAKAVEPFLVYATENGNKSSDESQRGTYRIDFESFEKMKFIAKMPQVDKFYICSNPLCAHIYWEGCHSNRFIPSIKSLIEDA